MVLSLTPLKTLLSPRRSTESESSVQKHADATSVPDVPALDGKKGAHHDSDGESSVREVADAAELDPELNPGGLSFEEGK